MKNFISATKTGVGETSSLLVVAEDGERLVVPQDPGNRWYSLLLQQVDAGDLVIAPYVAPSPTPADLRGRRDALLSATDWRFRSDMSPSQAWVDYCQALRDVPQQAGFPTSVTWPTEPSN